MKKMLGFILLFLTSCTPVTPIPVTATSPVTVTPSPVITDTPVSQDGAFLPDPSLTPGALNPAVSQDTIQSTICVPGYSSSIRPPVSYTDALKLVQIKQYGYADTNPADYEEDHFIPLSTGGNPTDPHNLWPQPRNTTPYNAASKDQLEYVLYKDVCAGLMSLSTAQSAIVSDWVAAYKIYVTPSLLLSITPEP